MSWVKLDDQFFSHPKAREAGRDAVLLYLAGLTYCARHLTDGRIPKSAVAVVAAESWAKASSAKVLATVGFWHEFDDHYLVHDYLDRNPSREKVLSEREASAKRRARGGRASGDVRATDGRESDVPSRPDVPSEQEKARRRSTSPPPDFVPTDEHRTYATERGLNIDDEVIWWLARCEAKGMTYQSHNGAFTTWLHHAVQFGRGGPPVADIAPALGVLELGDPVGRLAARKCPLDICDGSGNLEYEGRPRGTPMPRCECVKVRT